MPCLRREKRSSSAAATVSPSTTSAAAGSWKTALRPSTLTAPDPLRCRPGPSIEAPLPVPLTGQTSPAGRTCVRGAPPRCQPPTPAADERDTAMQDSSHSFGAQDPADERGGPGSFSHSASARGPRRGRRLPRRPAGRRLGGGGPADHAVPAQPRARPARARPAAPLTGAWPRRPPPRPGHGAPALLRPRLALGRKLRRPIRRTGYTRAGAGAWGRTWHGERARTPPRRPSCSRG